MENVGREGVNGGCGESEGDNGGCGESEGGNGGCGESEGGNGVGRVKVILYCKGYSL